MATLCVALAMAGAAWSQSSQDALADIQRRLQAGDGAGALERIDAALAKRPDDAAMQFRRGVALSLVGRETEAETVFKRLAEEHPEIPASSNNLAVLYSRRGDYQKAREALEKATQAYPGYGAAYANLGDVYAQLASQAYSKALGLDTPDPTLSDKIARLQGVLSQAGPTAGARPLRTPGAQATLTAATATATAAAAEAPSPSAAVDGAGDVEAAVAAWAAAWSRRDIPSYVAAYTADFAGDAASHAAWVQERSTRILPRRHIEVAATALHVEVHGDHAVARFRQSYRSDSANETGRKTLRLVRRDGGRWLIERETAGD